MAITDISLSDASIKVVVALCKTIKLKNSNNVISVDMAEGISEYVEIKRLVSKKQAQWLCRNAKFWKAKLPTELLHFELDQVPSAKPIAIMPQNRPSEEICRKMIRCLKRIERLLESRLPQ
jgi:hypothetical protein